MGKNGKLEEAQTFFSVEVSRFCRYFEMQRVPGAPPGLLRPGRGLHGAAAGQGGLWACVGAESVAGGGWRAGWPGFPWPGGAGGADQAT